MRDYLIYFDGGHASSGVPKTVKYYDCPKDEVIQKAKRLGLKREANVMTVSEIRSGKIIGYWERHGSLWYAF